MTYIMLAICVTHHVSSLSLSFSLSLSLSISPSPLSPLPSYSLCYVKATKKYMEMSRLLERERAKREEAETYNGTLEICKNEMDERMKYLELRLSLSLLSLLFPSLPPSPLSSLSFHLTQ